MSHSIPVKLCPTSSFIASSISLIWPWIVQFEKSENLLVYKQIKIVNSLHIFTEPRVVLCEHKYGY